jgi:tetratricopeptide (TPR) repeat protein
MPRTKGGALEAAEWGAGLAAKGQWAEALPWLERAVAIEPVPAFLANLAVAYARMGLDPQAEEAFQRALELAPHDALLREYYAAFRAGRTGAPHGGGTIPRVAAGSSALQGKPSRRRRAATPLESPKALAA